METKHPLTKLEEELISILIETFKNHGWTIDELPTIFDSDEKPNEFSSNTEFLDIKNYLGEYRIKDKCFKGEVVLYLENIKYLSDRYLSKLEMRGKEIDGKPIFIFLTTDDYSISANEIFDYLKSIVLIHELTHWMIHWNSDFNQKSLKCDDKYEGNDVINFHEGLAQYFTDYVIRNYGNKKIVDLFDSLKSKQSKPYKIFEELKTDLDGNSIDVAYVFTALGICWNNNFNQSFNELKNFNFLSVLYYPEEHKKSYHKIVQKEPAIDQVKITDWWSKEPFSDPDTFLYDYFNSENKKKYKTNFNSRKFGL